MARKNETTSKTNASDDQLNSELAAAGVKGGSTTVAAKSGPEAVAKTTGTTRPRIPEGAKPSEVLAIHIEKPEDLYAAAKLMRGDPIDAANFKVVAGKIDPLAKKVGEKAVNLLRHRNEPEKIQVYTRLGLQHLVEQGEASSKSLTTMFQTKYKDGTARAQANQLMQLFPALGIADRDGSNLKLSGSSMIASDFKRATAK